MAPSTRSKKTDQSTAPPPSTTTTRRSTRTGSRAISETPSVTAAGTLDQQGEMPVKKPNKRGSRNTSRQNSEAPTITKANAAEFGGSNGKAINTATADDIGNISSKTFMTAKTTTTRVTRSNSRAGSEAPLEALATFTNAKTRTRITRSSSSRNNSVTGSEAAVEAAAAVASTTIININSNAASNTGIAKRVTRSSSRNTSRAGSEDPSHTGQDVTTVTKAKVTKRKTRAGSTTSADDDNNGDTLKAAGKGARRPKHSHRTFSKLGDATQPDMHPELGGYIQPSIEQGLPEEASIEEYRKKSFGPPDDLVKAARRGTKRGKRGKERSFSNEGLVKLGDGEQYKMEIMEQRMMEQKKLSPGQMIRAMSQRAQTPEEEAAALAEVAAVVTARGRAELDDEADMIAEFEESLERESQQEQDAMSQQSEQEQVEVSSQPQDLPYEELTSQQHMSPQYTQPSSTEHASEHTQQDMSPQYPQLSQTEPSPLSTQQDVPQQYTQPSQTEQEPQPVQQQYDSPPHIQSVEHEPSPPAEQVQQSQQESSEPVYKPYKTHRHRDWTPRPQRVIVPRKYTGPKKVVRRKPSPEERRAIEEAEARLQAEIERDALMSPLIKPEKRRALAMQAEVVDDDFFPLEPQPVKKIIPTPKPKMTRMFRDKALQDEIAAYKAKKLTEAEREAERQEEIELGKSLCELSERSPQHVHKDPQEEHTPSNNTVALMDGAQDDDEVDDDSTPVPAKPTVTGYLSNLLGFPSPWKAVPRLSSLFSPAKKPTPTKIEKATVPASKTRLAKQKMVQKGLLSPDQPQQKDQYQGQEMQGQNQQMQVQVQQMQLQTQRMTGHIRPKYNAEGKEYNKHGGIDGENSFGLEYSDVDDGSTQSSETDEERRQYQQLVGEGMVSDQPTTTSNGTKKYSQPSVEDEADAKLAPPPVNNDAVLQTRQPYDLDTMEYPETNNNSNGMQPMLRDTHSAGARFEIKQSIKHNILKRKRAGSEPMGMPIDEMATISESPELAFQTPARATNNTYGSNTDVRPTTGLIPRSRRTVKGARAAREARYRAANPPWRPCWMVDPPAPVRDKNADQRLARVQEVLQLRANIAEKQKTLEHYEANYEMPAPLTKKVKYKHLRKVPARDPGDVSGTYRFPDYDSDEEIEVPIDTEEVPTDYYSEDEDDAATPKASKQAAATPGSFATATPMSIDNTLTTPKLTTATDTSDPFTSATNAPLPSQQAAGAKRTSPDIEAFAQFIPMLKKGHVSYFDTLKDTASTAAPLPMQPAANAGAGYMYLDTAPPPLTPDELASDRDEEIDLLFEEDEDWPEVPQMAEGEKEVMTQEEQDEAWVEGRNGFVEWLRETGQVRNFVYRGEEWVGQWDGVANPEVEV